MGGTSLRRHGLSKSRITAFEQCPKKLWLSVHRKEQAQWDDGSEARFAAGNSVGDAACSIHPEGVMIEAVPHLSTALATTAELVASDHPGPIFEATFQHEGVLVRVDVLERAGNGWHAAEVKSSSGVKDYHHGDLATQIWVMREAGLTLSGASLRHVDRSFVLTRAGEYSGLFRDVPMMDELEPLIATRGAVVASATEVLAGVEPVVPTGAHCSKPFACEFSAYCSSGQPQAPEWGLDCLPGQGRAKWVQAGYTSLLELPEDNLSPQFSKILRATRTETPFHDAQGARQDMSDWGYPRVWLDFETIAPAVPRWVGTRPYQQVPFQFSLHLEQANGEMTHHGFLSLDGTDPRRSCAAALVDLIPADASIVAYFASFERGVLRDLARHVPEYSEALLDMAERTVDLLPVARRRWYHRDQRGSWSIKAVLPTIAPELDYASLAVKDGASAQEAWMEAADPNCDASRIEEISEALRTYCERDTWAMVVIAAALAGEGG